MKIRFEPSFYRYYKKSNVIIRNKFDLQFLIFKKDPNSPELNNHALRREWKGYRSINIKVDYRAIYKEVKSGDEVVAYFIAIGTHKELYSS